MMHVPFPFAIIIAEKRKKDSRDSCLFSSCARKAGPVLAALTKRMHEPAFLKAFANGKRLWRTKDVDQRCLEHVAKDRLSIGIETAGHHAPIAQDGSHITQAPACPCIRNVRTAKIRPCKRFIHAQKTSWRKCAAGRHVLKMIVRKDLLLQ